MKPYKWSRFFGNFVYDLLSDGSKGKLIATFYPLNGTMDELNEAFSKAKLCAAAPELLHACELLMRADGMQKGERGGCVMGEISQAIDAARLAIMKAKGIQ